MQANTVAACTAMMLGRQFSSIPGLGGQCEQLRAQRFGRQTKRSWIQPLLQVELTDHNSEPSWIDVQSNSHCCKVRFINLESVLAAYGLQPVGRDANAVNADVGALELPRRAGRACSDQIQPEGAGQERPAARAKQSKRVECGLSPNEHTPRLHLLLPKSGTSCTSGSRHRAEAGLRRLMGSPMPDEGHP